MRRRGIIVGGITLLLLFGCNNGIAELEKENSFYKSVVKIGQGFQEIFGIFGNAMGDALGFRAVKSDDTRDKVGKHFEKVKQGLESTNRKLKELSGEIFSTKNADTKGVETAISSASGVIEKLIASVKKLSEVTSKGGSTPIGDAQTSASKAAGATEGDVKIVAEGVKEIIETATSSDVTINNGEPGTEVANGGGNAGAAVVGKQNSQADANAAAKLASEVAKADPWAMIDKIKHVKISSGANTDAAAANNDARILATKLPGNDTHNGAKTNADLAAAVALKAMTQGGKFSAQSASADEGGAVKAAAANAVNKVLGVLDEIIRRTVNHQLVKIKDAVKGINYSETTGTEVTETKK